MLLENPESNNNLLQFHLKTEKGKDKLLEVHLDEAKTVIRLKMSGQYMTAYNTGKSFVVLVKVGKRKGLFPEFITSTSDPVVVVSKHTSISAECQDT